MEISASMIKELRERTGAGILDCKKALMENEGDVENAVDWLLKKGIAAAAKKSGRVASEGIIHAYIHHGSRLGVMVEVNCETDFVAKTDDFKNFANDICLQIAANNPQYVQAEDVPKPDVDKQREIFMAQAAETGKPKPVLEKIVEGKVSKWLKDACLLTQPFLRDTDMTIDDLRKEKIAKIGENIVVRRFSRWELGEGIAKPQEEDYAAEVAKLAGGDQ